MSEFPDIDQGVYFEPQVPVVSTEGPVMLSGIVPFALGDDMSADTFAALEQRRIATQDELDQRRTASDQLLQPLFDRTKERMGEFSNMGLVKNFFQERTTLSPDFERIVMINDLNELHNLALDARLGEQITVFAAAKTSVTYLAMMDAVFVVNPHVFETSTDRSYYEASLVFALAESCIQNRYKNHIVLARSGTYSIFTPTTGGMRAYRLKDALGSSDPQNPIGSFYNDGWAEYTAGKYREFKRETAPEECRLDEAAALKTLAIRPGFQKEDLKYAELFQIAPGKPAIGINSDPAYAAMALEQLDRSLQGRLLPAIEKAMVQQSAENQRVVAELVRQVDPKLHLMIMKTRQPIMYPMVLNYVKDVTSARSVS